MINSSPRKVRVLPVTKAGWWALGLSVLGVISWVILPMITMVFREKYPVTNSYVMPLIGTVLIDIAAVFNILCLWHWRERSALNIALAVLVIPVAVFFTIIVVGEGIAGI